MDHNEGFFSAEHARGKLEQAFLRHFWDVDGERVRAAVWLSTNHHQIWEVLADEMMKPPWLHSPPDPTAPSAYPADHVERVRSRLRPVKPRAGAPTPPFPMTLDELLAAIRRENPAPADKDKKYIGGADWALAWGLSAPEGFPPWPARGSTYSSAEMSQVGSWIRHLWPARVEAVNIGREADYRVLRGGIRPDDSFADDMTTIFDGAMSTYGAIRGETPQDVYDLVMLNMKRSNLGYYLDNAKSAMPEMLYKQSDPDGHLEWVKSSCPSLVRRVEELYLPSRLLTTEEKAIRKAYESGKVPFGEAIRRTHASDAAYRAAWARDSAAQHVVVSRICEVLPKISNVTLKGLARLMPEYRFSKRESVNQQVLTITAPDIEVFAYGRTLHGALWDLCERAAHLRKVAATHARGTREAGRV